MYVFVCLFFCVTSPGHTNNDTDLKLGTHTPIDLIWKFFFVFSIKSLWVLPALKNCRVRWMLRISPRLPCLRFGSFQKSFKTSKKITWVPFNKIWWIKMTYRKGVQSFNNEIFDKKMRFSTKNACKILTNCPRNLNLDLKWSLELSWWLNTLLGKNYGSKALFENGIKMRDSNRTWVYSKSCKISINGSRDLNLGLKSSPVICLDD